GLLIRSFIKLVNVDPGFRTQNIISFDVSIPDLKYPFDRDKNRYVRAVTEALSQMPGTKSVAVVFSRPLQRRGMRTTFTVDGRPAPSRERPPLADVHPASASFFGTLGI